MTRNTSAEVAAGTMFAIDSVALVTAFASLTCRSIVPEVNVVPMTCTASVQLAAVPTKPSPSTMPSASTARTRSDGRARMPPLTPTSPPAAAAGRPPDEHGAGVAEQPDRDGQHAPLPLLAGQQRAGVPEVGHRVPERAPNLLRAHPLLVGCVVGVTLVCRRTPPPSWRAIATTRWVATVGWPETSWKVITVPSAIRRPRPAEPRSSCPAGRLGCIDPVSTVYGVAPPSRGTSTATASTPTASSNASGRRGPIRRTAAPRRPGGLRVRGTWAAV